MRTIIHGDPKAANVFVRDGEAGVDVAWIDFQWTGFGLAATDVAHHICAAVRPDGLVGPDGTDLDVELLDLYYGALSAALVQV